MGLQVGETWKWAVPSTQLDFAEGEQRAHIQLNRYSKGPSRAIM